MGINFSRRLSMSGYMFLVKVVEFLGTLMLGVPKN